MDHSESYLVQKRPFPVCRCVRDQEDECIVVPSRLTAAEKVFTLEWKRRTARCVAFAEDVLAEMYLHSG